MDTSSGIRRGCACILGIVWGAPPTKTRTHRTGYYSRQKRLFGSAPQFCSIKGNRIRPQIRDGATPHGTNKTGHVGRNQRHTYAIRILSTKSRSKKYSSISSQHRRIFNRTGQGTSYWPLSAYLQTATRCTRSVRFCKIHIFSFLISWV